MIFPLIRTIFCWFLYLIFLVLFAIPFLICLMIPQRIIVDNWFFKRVAGIFYWFVITFSFLKITYKGLGNIPDTPVLVVANHQSSFDIPLIGYAMQGRPHVWLALKDLLKSFIFWLILPRVAVLVDTSSPVSGMRTLVEAINLIKAQPWNMIIFPEGGRFTDGEVREFMAGFAVIARKSQRPVVPIKIIGIEKAYPPNSFLIHQYPIDVIVGKPLYLAEGETDDDFSKRVYTWFVETTF